jgi:DNA-binding cell septation regulator SpoVG
MTERLKITDVRFVAAAHDDVAHGLLGWIRCTLNDSLRVDGIAVRRTLAGKLAISFPARTDGWGQRHSILRPLSDRVRRELEQQIFHALRMEDGVTR